LPATQLVRRIFRKRLRKEFTCFKSSSTNLKKLRKSIRESDVSTSVELVDFHIKWLEEIPLLFPSGSEDSTSNGSDASADIWHDTKGFKKQAGQYNLSSKRLTEALRINDFSQINNNFESLVKSCKTCQRHFQN
jgi:cytochrome c556